MANLCEMYTCTNRVTVPTVGWPGLCLDCATQQHKEFTKLMPSVLARAEAQPVCTPKASGCGFSHDSASLPLASVTSIHRSK